MDSVHIKCGEVYYLVPSVFHINCMECGQKILFQQFLQHYRLQHLAQAEDSIDIQPINIKKLKSSSLDSLVFSPNESGCGHSDEDNAAEYYKEARTDNDLSDEGNYDELSYQDKQDDKTEEYLTIELISDDEKTNSSVSSPSMVFKVVAENKIDVLWEVGKGDGDCKSGISDAKNLNENKESDETNNCKSFECHICHRVLKTKYILSNHMRVVHASKTKANDSNISCRFCSVVCKSRFDLLVHKRKHHAERYASSNLGGTIKTPPIEENEILRPVPCNLCKRRFRNESSLAIHMRVHKGKIEVKPKVTRAVVCEKCGKLCRSRRHLERHQKRYHGSSFCDICKKEFKQPIDAYRHRSFHLKPKNFKCTQCDIACCSPSSLQKHLRTHLPKGRNADQRKEMQSTRRHICEICGRDFRTGYLLNNHMQRHNNERPFNCDKCEKSFYSRPLLKLHSVTHSSDRPFVCDICGATFQYKRALRVHADLHTGFRNFKCSYCEKAYVDGGRLKTHIRLVHGGLVGTIQIPTNITEDDFEEHCRNEFYEHEEHPENKDYEVVVATKNLEQLVKEVYRE